MPITLRDLINVAAAAAAARAVQQVMDEQYPTLPRLSWSRNKVDGLSGQVDAGHWEHEVTALVATWADAHGLTEDVGWMAGAIAFVGEVDGQRVRVWGVVDREVWEREEVEGRG